MLARALALLAVVAIPSLADAISEAPVAIYLKAGSAKGPALISFELELSKLMQSAGYNVEWIEAPATPEVSNARLISLELAGPCAPDQAQPGDRGDMPAEVLASAPLFKGRILPFGVVRCEALNRVVGRALAAAPSDERALLYGRALARLAAHEFYHILSGEAQHSREGISKAFFSANDLLADSLWFEAAALSKLRAAAIADCQVGGADVLHLEPLKDTGRL